MTKLCLRLEGFWKKHNDSNRKSNHWNQITVWDGDLDLILSSRIDQTAQLLILEIVLRGECKWTIVKSK